MSGPVFVGVDVGTQSAKAAVFELSGTCLGETSVPLPLYRRAADEVEQEPEDFYGAATAAIASCVAVSGRSGDVACIAVAGQMAGVLGIGPDGQAVTPYDSWLDSRCRPEVEAIAEGMGDRFVELTGCPPMVAHAAKIAWWRRWRTDDYRRVAKFVVPNAYVAGRLCELDADEVYLDQTHLHFSGLAEAASATWSGELTSALGVDLVKLPRIVSPTELVGRLSVSAAAHCGLVAGTPLAAGLGDTAAGALGAGMVEAGQLLDTAGTASVLALSTTAFRPDFSRTLVQMRGAVPGQWISLAYLAGGDLLRWLPQVLGDPPLERLVEEASASPGGRLLFVPHLGGRILPSAPDARGAWVGLDLSQTRGDLARAVLESVAFEYMGFLERALELFPDIVAREVRVIGGGGGDALWNLIKASVLGLPYVTLERESFSCWGAAMVAAAAVGAVDDLAATALATTAEAGRVMPDVSLRSLYDTRKRDYRAVVDLLVAPRKEGHE